ncbi:hypothetical protein [Streptomyces sp. Tu 4128]|uniref:hypothetical protein n=1 Tax=Streptomyces sp. Tu 4128 TaxID=1120314 RepID=UPI000F021D88|nr:hypothetical protein [Streptomyces sp. Tu 4128]
MQDTLTFWMTVVGTVAGVVSMAVAVLDRRGPRQQRRGPHLLQSVTRSLIYGLAVVGAALIVIAAPFFNAMCLMERLDLTQLGCAIGLAVNALGLSLHRWHVMDSGAVERKAYGIFCWTCMAIYVVLLIVRG